MADVLQLDDNLINGRTYTFQFKCANWFCLSDISSTLANDIYANAPDFITSLQVTSPALTSLYNVQFTYEGDGTDVVSDLANSLVAAFQVGSSDAMTFLGAVAAPASAVVVSIANATATIEQGASNAVNKVVTDAAKTATGAVNTTLMGLLPLLAVVVAIILFVLPSFVKSTGVRASVG